MTRAGPGSQALKDEEVERTDAVRLVSEASYSLSLSLFVGNINFLDSIFSALIFNGPKWLEGCRHLALCLAAVLRPRLSFFLLWFQMSGSPSAHILAVDNSSKMKPKQLLRPLLAGRSIINPSP